MRFCYNHTKLIRPFYLPLFDLQLYNQRNSLSSQDLNNIAFQVTQTAELGAKSAVALSISSFHLSYVKFTAANQRCDPH